MGSVSPPPVIQRLDEIAENTAWSSTPIFDWLGVRFRILYAERDVFVHDCEHVVDPRTGHEALVMADPHIYKGVRVYDLKKREMVWEYQVPGSAVASNPHCAHMLTFDLPGWNAEAGDLIMADRDNRVIVVDRDTKEVKKAVTPPEVSWLHETLPDPDMPDIIVTDYLRGSISRLTPDGTFTWDVTGMGNAAKASLIPAGIHTASFGGHAVVALNQDIRGVVEVNRDDGSIPWQKPEPLNGDKVNFGTLLTKPHSAFRMGGVEVYGNPTVVGLEAGGGIVAIDHYGRPLWGFVGGMSTDKYGVYYYPTPHGLLEVTDVFPTLDGLVGFAAQAGYGCTLVGELLGVPRKRVLSWMVLWNKTTGDDWEELKPPISMAGWDELLLIFQNIHDSNSADVEVSAIPFHYANWDWVYNWGMYKTIDAHTIGPGEKHEVYVDKPYPMIRVRWRSSTPGSPATLRAFAVHRGR